MNLDPELGASLLEILGQRIVYFIEKQNPSKSLDIYASMTTSLSQWLKKQVSIHALQRQYFCFSQAEICISCMSCSEILILTKF